MSPTPPQFDLPLDPAAGLGGDELKACCSDLYAHPAVRWLLGGELHPGGAATTRRALELIEAGPGDRLLDVASGDGASALLAARERGCEVVGIDYSSAAVEGANGRARRVAPEAAIEFARGDAEALPVSDDSFDAVLCECSLCTFPDKATAAAEFARVLRPGGRIVLSDVTAESERLPSELVGGSATIACVGEALSSEGYLDLLRDAGFEPFAFESRDDKADELAQRVEERLRGARLLGIERLGLPVDDAIDLIRRGRAAIATGALGYSIFAARLRTERP